MRHFHDLLRVLRHRNNPILLSYDIFSLRSALSGFVWVTKNAPEALRDTANRLPGPSQADLCTRALLCSGDPTRAIAIVLDVLESLAEDSIGGPGPRSTVSVPEITISSIEEERPQIVLPEATIESLANYWNGHLAGLRLHSPDEADRQTVSLQGFEDFVSKAYDHKLSWHVLIRVFDGPCANGLRRFVELWRQFERSPRC